MANSFRTETCDLGPQLLCPRERSHLILFKEWESRFLRPRLLETQDDIHLSCPELGLLGVDRAAMKNQKLQWHWVAQSGVCLWGWKSEDLSYPKGHWVLRNIVFRPWILHCSWNGCSHKLIRSSKGCILFMIPDVERWLERRWSFCSLSFSEVNPWIAVQTCWSQVTAIKGDVDP